MQHYPFQWLWSGRPYRRLQCNSKFLPLSKAFYRDQDPKVINCFFTNLFLGWLDQRPIIFHRRRISWRSSPRWKLPTWSKYEAQVPVLDYLIDQGDVIQVIGSQKEKRATIIWASPELEKVFAELLQDKEHVVKLIRSTTQVYSNTNNTSQSPLALRDKDKLPVDYTSFKNIQVLEDKVNYINQFQATINIQQQINNNNKLLIDKVTVQAEPNHHQPTTIYTINPSIQSSSLYIESKTLGTIRNELLNLRKSYTRIFSRSSWNCGGRFYAPYFQSLSEVDRSSLLLNNQSVVELDYESIHPSMLYAKEGIHLQHDPYSLPHLPSDRKANKRLLNCAINAKDKRSAIGATILSLRKKGQLNLLNGTKLNEIYDGLIEKNKPIEKYLSSDIGIRLMRTDSDIACDVLTHFTRKKIPCLCVHDSFVVPQQHKQELHDVMLSTYQDRVHQSIGIS